MNKIPEIINFLIQTEAFRSLLNSKRIEICQINAAIDILIRHNIGFDVCFIPRTCRDAGCAKLIIFVTSTIHLEFVFYFLDGCFNL